MNDKDKVLQDRAPGESLKATGSTKDLPYGIRGVAAVDYVSSLAFRETYSPTFTEAVNSEATGFGFLTKDFGDYKIQRLCIPAIRTSSPHYRHTSARQACAKRCRRARLSFGRRRSSPLWGWTSRWGKAPSTFLSRLPPERSDARNLASPFLRSQSGWTSHPAVTLRLPEFWGFHFTPSLGIDAARYGISLNPNPNR